MDCQLLITLFRSINRDSFLDIYLRLAAVYFHFINRDRIPACPFIIRIILCKWIDVQAHISCFLNFIQHDCIFQCLRTILYVLHIFPIGFRRRFCRVCDLDLIVRRFSCFPENTDCFYIHFFSEIDINPVRGVRYRATPSWASIFCVAVKRFRRDQTIIFCRICCWRFFQSHVFFRVLRFFRSCLFFITDLKFANRNAVKSSCFQRLHRQLHVSVTYRFFQRYHCILRKTFRLFILRLMDQSPLWIVVRTFDFELPDQLFSYGNSCTAFT